MRRRTFLLALFAAALGAAQTARADLTGFMAKPEPAFHWEKQAETKVDGGTIYELTMVSQTWQGIDWDHRLKIYRPDKLVYPHFCALYNTGRDNEKRWATDGMRIARNSGATYAVVFDNPKQPLYGGLREDELIVYTWLKFVKTNDESWPLHFPMAKAVVKAMDAIQAFAVQEKLPAINDFLITGASKRGWTTWLVGATQDKRVRAIAPMVIDTLHVAIQMPHQLAAYGAASEQVADYTRAGMFSALKTKEGQRLLQLEDPWSYRSILTLPKLIILGTNDQYWAQDALNLYWDDLVGPKWVTYTPNSGHGLEERDHMYSTLEAFIDRTAGHKPWPQMHWGFTESAVAVRLNVKSDNLKPSAARLFRVYAPTQDFRGSHWTSEPMAKTAKGFTARLDKPETGYAATFGEVEFVIGGKTFTLSTQMHILGHK